MTQTPSPTLKLLCGKMFPKPIHTDTQTNMEWQTQRPNESDANSIPYRDEKDPLTDTLFTTSVLIPMLLIKPSFSLFHPLLSSSSLLASVAVISYTVSSLLRGVFCSLNPCRGSPPNLPACQITISSKWWWWIIWHISTLLFFRIAPNLDGKWQKKKEVKINHNKFWGRVKLRP